MGAGGGGLLMEGGEEIWTIDKGKRGRAGSKEVHGYYDRVGTGTKQKQSL